jgi:multidrug resistance efflux pump
VAVATSEARAKVTRLEEQLRHAHAELDKLRAKVQGPAPVAARRTEGNDGFAPTQTFGDTRS